VQSWDEIAIIGQLTVKPNHTQHKYWSGGQACCTSSYAPDKEILLKSPLVMPCAGHSLVFTGCTTLWCHPVCVYTVGTWNT